MMKSALIGCILGLLGLVGAILLVDDSGPPKARTPTYSSPTPTNTNNDAIRNLKIN